MQPPYPEKHRGKPLRDKKDCREKKRTAEEKESLLAGRGGNSNGTRKAAGGEKRTAEEKRKFAGGKRRKQQRDKKGHRRKKENRRKTRKPAGEKAEPSWAAKRVQKKSGRKPVSQLSKRTKTALSGTCRSGKVLLSLCRFTETVPIWPKHSIYS
ncbi:hypothetical protein [uncultured Alistipes sp.]|uniref:hypothetical protein n=1 Tax=uncultured Alistipes sp. TaxID=538949 RepID=UPI00258CE784|nr:hypothetical protein [uncultured Alistipes sp.]